jgi:PAS domain S-box-containing protein
MRDDRKESPNTPLSMGAPASVVAKSKSPSHSAQSLHELAFESSRDGMFVIDIEGNYLAVNKAGCALFGYSKEEFLAADVSLLYFEEDLTQENAGLQRELWESGIDVIEIRLRCKDGTEIWVEMSIQPFMRENERQVLGTARDITARKRLQLSAEESNVRFRTLFEKSADAHLIIENEMFIDCNQATVEMLRYKDKEEFFNKVHPATLSPSKQPDGRDSLEKAEEMMKIALEKGTNRFEWDHMRSDGEVFPAEVLLTTLVNEKDRRVIYTVWRDITVQKTINDTQQFLAQKGWMGAGYEFFPSLVKHVADILKVDYAFVATVDDDSVSKTVALYVQGNIVDNIEYELVGTPCNNVYAKDICAYEKNVQELFPEDKMLVDMGAEGYVGMPLWDSTGKSIGLIAVLSTQQINHVTLVKMVLQLISVRVSGELERKQAEQALIQEKKITEDYINSLPGLFYVFDDKTFVKHNKEFEIVSGYSNSELNQMYGPDFFDEVEAKYIGDRMKAVFEDGESQAEADLITKDGIRIPYYFTGARKEIAGKPHIVGLAIDISERRKAETALRESESKFRNVIEQSNDAIYIISDGRFVLVNKKFSVLTGVSVEQALNPDFKFMDLVAPESRSIIEKRAAAWDRGETPESVYEFTIINKGSNKILVQASISQIEYGEGIGYLGILRDITIIKKLENELLQSQKLESIGRLAGGVAHDFNNVLTVILGNVEMMLMESDPSQQLYSDLKEIETAANRSADLTRQLLGFARKQTVTPKSLNLNETVTDMLKILERLIGEGINLIWRPSNDLWNVKIDPSQVDQILANLSVNARDAVDGVGKLIVETENVILDEAYCQTHPDLAPGEYVMLAVSDNGPGMDQDVLDKLFEPFFTTKEVGEGTGLGLATVFGIVKQNEGFIDVYSEPGVGSVFKVYLPRHLGENSETPEKEISLDTFKGEETVLIVEDEESILKLSERILSTLGYSVLVANSPKVAIKICEERQDKIHLLISDVIMPDMNGRDLAAKLESSCTDLKKLFMSGYTANVISDNEMLMNGEHFIQKPFKMNSFAKKVREALDT